MDDRTEEMLDRALAQLARDVETATPRPGPDLIARVLADAAAAAPPQPERGPELVPARGGLWERMFGWTGGAVAALSLCLVVGVGVGLSLDPSEMPVLGDGGEELAMSVEGALMPEDLL